MGPETQKIRLTDRISVLGLPKATELALTKANIKYVRDLDIGKDNLLKVPGIWLGRMMRIRTLLREHDIPIHF